MPKVSRYSIPYPPIYPPGNSHSHLFSSAKILAFIVNFFQRRLVVIDRLFSFKNTSLYLKTKIKKELANP